MMSLSLAREWNIRDGRIIEWQAWSLVSKATLNISCLPDVRKKVSLESSIWRF